MKDAYLVTEELDRELLTIKDIIIEAYKKDTGITPFIEVEDGNLCYILLDLWCKDEDDIAFLLRIVLKVIDMFPNRIYDMTKLLLCKTAIINAESIEINFLHRLLYDLSYRRLH